MNKKKLPKAFVLTADAMREAPPDSPARSDARPAADPHQPETASSAGLPGNVIEMMPKPEGAAAATASTAANPAADSANLARRRRQARAIIERHANFSAIGGAIPVPVANVAAITGLIVRMVRQLSRLYGVPFERTRARAIVIGLMGGIMPTGVATIATSTLTYFVPGYGAIGLAVSSVTASAYARSIGQMFVEHFENGSTLVDFPSVVLR
jgi:uncharacterized protein (DUF697 family)